MSWKNLILAISPWASNIKRIEHLEEIQRASLQRDVPFGIITAAATLPAAGSNFSCVVDTTLWMAVGQRLMISRGTSRVYVEVVSIETSISVTLKVLELIGFSVGAALANGDKVTLGVHPQEVIGHVTCTVGAGWVANSGKKKLVSYFGGSRVNGLWFAGTHNFETDDPVYLTGTLPDGIMENTTYYAYRFDPYWVFLYTGPSGGSRSLIEFPNTAPSTSEPPAIFSRTAWAPAQTSATVTANFNGRERSITVNLDTATGLIATGEYVMAENDISVQVTNSEGTHILFTFTDSRTGAVRQHTIHSIKAWNGDDGDSGPAGLDGVLLLSAEAWAGNKNYYSTDKYRSSVVYSNGLYVAKASNKDKEPIPGESDSYWEYLGPVDLLIDPPESWGFVEEFYNGGDPQYRNTGYLVLPQGAQFELGWNKDLVAGQIDEVVHSVGALGQDQSEGDEWPTLGLRRVFSTEQKSEYAILRFKTYFQPAVTVGSSAYVEGKHRLVRGQTYDGVDSWQNLDGGRFVGKIGPSQVSLHCVYAERIYGSGSCAIATNNWGGGDPTGGYIQHDIINGTGFMAYNFIGATDSENLFVKIPKGTAYRLSFLFIHTPD